MGFGQPGPAPPPPRVIFQKLVYKNLIKHEICQAERMERGSERQKSEHQKERRKSNFQILMKCQLPMA